MQRLILLQSLVFQVNHLEYFLKNLFNYENEETQQ